MPKYLIHFLSTPSKIYFEFSQRIISIFFSFFFSIVAIRDSIMTSSTFLYNELTLGE